MINESSKERVHLLVTLPRLSAHSKEESGAKACKQPLYINI